MVQGFSTGTESAQTLGRIQKNESYPEGKQQNDKDINISKTLYSHNLLRKEQHVYVMKFSGRNDLVLTKVGISKEVPRRHEELNGNGMNRKQKPNVYEVCAVFYLNSNILSRTVEKEVCKKFKIWAGRELLDTHPSKVIEFIKKRIKKMGFTKDDYWIQEDFI